MREINYTVGVDSISPSTVQFGGFAGEDRATVLNFELDGELGPLIFKDDDTKVSYILELINNSGVYDAYPLKLQVTNDAEIPPFAIPKEITELGGRVNMQLSIIELDNKTLEQKRKLFTYPIKLRFEPSVSGGIENAVAYEKYHTNTVGAMVQAKQAVEAAKENADNAATSESKAATSASEAANSATTAAASKEAAAGSATAAANSATAAQTAKTEVEKIKGDIEKIISDEVDEAVDGVMGYINETADDVYAASVSAEAAADRAEAAAGKSWAVYKTVTLESAAAAYSEQVELVCDTSKGLCIRVILPANTALHNNRLAAYISLNGNRQLIVRGESWATSDSETVGCFIIRPVAEVWNAEVAPYVKTVAGIVGNLNYAEGDKVRYVKFQTNEDNPIPAGTKFEFWGLQ